MSAASTSPIMRNSADKNRILLVEDYPANVLVATAYLDSFNLEYDVASSGTEAIAAFKKQHYAVILMDVQMQDMDGFEATCQIRQIEQAQHLAHTPIIAMTAHALAGDRQNCLDKGMDDYIAKPFNPDELQSKIFHYMPTQQAPA